MLPVTRAYYAMNPMGGVGRPPAAQGARSAGALGEPRTGRFDTFGCQTCQNRTYQDGSNDPGVSFKTPTKVSPQAAASAVRSHEMEHVFREKGKAQAEGREVVSQSVTIHTGICAECGKTYTAGGTTKTVTRGKTANAFRVGLEVGGAGKGLNKVA